MKLKLIEILEIGDLKVDDTWNPLLNVEVSNISNLLSHALNKGGAYFASKSVKISIKDMQKLLKKNVIVFSDKDYYDDDGNRFHTIKVDDPYELYLKTAKVYKERFDIPTICITGSVGKTTTTNLANLVFNEKYKVLSTGITSNTPTYFIEELYSKLNNSYDIYIQETGALRSYVLEEGAKILNPDAFIITNINKNHHLDGYGTSESLIRDKTCYDKFSKKSAIGIINIDDEVLSNFKFNRDIITIGIHNQNADYICKNIVQNDDNLQFDIIDNKNNHVVKIDINIMGKHNAYNILAVYALAKKFDITDEEFIRGLKKYKSLSLRQNFDVICGRKIYMDSFNICADSIKSSLESLENVKVDKYNKKIVILGGENALGDLSYEVNFKTGKTLNKYNIDKLIIVGPKDNKNINLMGDGKALYDGAKTVIEKRKLVYYDDIFKVAKFIEEDTKPGDAILIKGIFRLGLFAAVDLAFGFDTIYRHTYFTSNAKSVEDDNFKGIVIEKINKINLLKYTGDSSSVVIPDYINNIEVANLNRGLFSNRIKLKKVQIGKNINCISDQAFMNCKNLKEINIPSNVKRIGKSAFENCTSLEKVTIENGLLSVDSRAFYNCNKLEKIEFPSSTIDIKNDAFKINNNNNISEVNMQKKIKKICKKILSKISLKRKRYVYNKIPIYSIKQICSIVKIKVPREFKEIKNAPVHKTYLFDILENKNEIREQIKCHKYRRPNYERKLKKSMRRFRDVYEEQKMVLKGIDTEFIQMMVEWLYVFNINGFYYYDYFDYELYNRTLDEANLFMSRRYWYKVYKTANNGKYTKILKDKEKFNKLFNKYVNRDFLNTTLCSYDEFEKFVSKHPKFFAKPIYGTGGYGAGIVDSNEWDINKLYKEMVKQSMIIEEIVTQHKDLAKFNASTLNTIRVYSLLCADGKVRVMMANIRTGREGNVVDNFHCGGMTAVIDVKSGIVTSDAIDLHHHLSDVHPDSKVKFKGFKIPCWEKLVVAVEEAGKLLPEMRHIGWDIAITKNGGVEFIEGNSMPNFDVAQAPDQRGKKYIYERYIKELEENKISDKK